MSESVPVADLIHFPGNARTHDIDVIAESLREHAQYQPIIVQKSTMFVAAGNGTLEAARDVLGWTEIDADILDLDDDEALRINLIDNRARDKGTYDERKLRDLIAPLAAAGDLTGTGFDLDAFDDLNNGLDEPPPDLDDPGGDDNPFGESDADHDKRAGSGSAGTGPERTPPLLLMYTGEEHGRYAAALAKVRTPDESQAGTVLRVLREAS